MKVFRVITTIVFCLTTGIVYLCFGKNQSLINSCKRDLDSIIEVLKQHSAPAKNLEDRSLQYWLHEGYKESLQQCNRVNNIDDVFVTLQNFTDRFNDPHIRVHKNAINKNSTKIASHYSISNLDGGVWITIPSFAPKNDKEISALQKILSSLKDFRNKKFIVFDLSGNGGGNSGWGRALLRNLWGDKYLRSLGKKHLYNQKWRKKIRLSYENFKHLNELDKFASSLQGQRQEDFYIPGTEEGSLYNDSENLYAHQDDTLVSAKVFVLTNSACMSACWHCVREMLQIPGVVHIGDKTNKQTIYSEVRSVKLPSGNFNIHFPICQFLAPLDHINKPFEPIIYYKGDFSDKIKKQEWFLKEVINKF